MAGGHHVLSPPCSLTEAHQMGTWHPRKKRLHCPASLAVRYGHEVSIWPRSRSSATDLTRQLAHALHPFPFLLVWNTQVVAKAQTSISVPKVHRKYSGKARWAYGSIGVPVIDSTAAIPGWLTSALPRLRKKCLDTSLVAQWLRICLPVQGTRVQALVWEDPTCRGANKPVRHNY